MKYIGDHASKKAIRLLTCHRPDTILLLMAGEALI